MKLVDDLATLLSIWSNRGTKFNFDFPMVIANSLTEEEIRAVLIWIRSLGPVTIETDSTSYNTPGGYADTYHVWIKGVSPVRMYLGFRFEGEDDSTLVMSRKILSELS